MMQSPKTATTSKSLATITPQKLNTNEKAVPLAYLAGADWLPITFCCSKIYSPFKIAQASSGGGKGSSSTTTYLNAGSVIGLVGCGAFDFIDAIKFDGEIVWEGMIRRDGSNPHFAGTLIPGLVGWRFYWGTPDQPMDDLVVPTCGELHPRYLDQGYLVLKGLVFAEGSGTPQTVLVHVGRAPRFAGLDETLAREGANPVTALAEMVGNDFFGLGRPELVHVASASALCDAQKRTKVVSIPGDAAHVAQMGYLSPFLVRKQSFSAFAGAVLENFDGWIRRRGSQLEFGAFPHDGITPTGLPELSLHDFESEPKFNNPGPSDESVITDALVKYRDRDWDMEPDSQPGTNPATFQRLKETRLKTFPRDFVITSYQAREQAAAIANYRARPEQAASGLSVRREKLGAVMPGDRFVLNYSTNNLRQIFRCTRRRDPGAGGTAEIAIVNERGLAPLGYIATAHPAPPLPDPPSPVVVAHARMVQLPVGFTDLIVPVAVPLIERPSDTSDGFRVAFSIADATYDLIGASRGFALRGSLAGALTAGTTTFTINASGRDLSILEPQSDAAKNDDTLLLFAGVEILSVGASTALGAGQYSVTCFRARKGSAAVTHPSGEEIFLIRRSELLLLTHADFPRGGGIRYFKLPTFTSTDEQDLADALKLTFTFADTRPAAPVLTAQIGTGKSVSLSWTKIATASEYGIWRNTTNNFATAVWQADVTALRFVDVNVALATTYYYWVVASEEDETNSAASNAASVTTDNISGDISTIAAAASAAQTTANNAQTAANNAQASANQANTAIAEIASDGLLTPDEKPRVIQDCTVITTEQAGIDAQATAYAITTEKAAYDTAVSALTSYLGGLTAPVAWNSLAGNTTIVGATFRAKFADVYTTRQTLLNAIYAAARLRADNAQTAANNAQTTANNAQTAASNAQASANQANTAIADIASDGLLTPDEKPRVIQDYSVITTEQAGIDANATTFGITTEKTAYDAAVTALTSYLGGLTTSVAWNNLAGNTTIVGATFRAKFADVYTTRQAVLNKIAATANPTAPGNPAAMTYNTGSAYLAADGTVLSRIVLNNPGAMPSGAALINILYRRSGASGWIVGQQITAGGGTSTIDDLTPGIAYDFAAQAFSPAGVGSAIVAATGSPFTAPTKSGGPANPTSIAAHTPSSSYPATPRYVAGFQYYASVITFTPSADRDAAYYEFGISSSAGVPPVAPADVWTTVPASAASFYYYTDTSAPQYLWVRTRDRSGGYSIWADSGYNLNGYLALAAGTISVQDADNVSTSGIKTGSGASVQKVLCRYPGAATVTFAGTANYEKKNISLSGRGFSTRPDTGNVIVDGGYGILAYYDLADPGCTSTNAVVFIYRPDGANLPAGSYSISFEFVEYL